MASTIVSSTNAAQNTLADELINRIAKLYPSLAKGFRKIVRQNLKPGDVEILRQEARESWRRTIEHLDSQKEHARLVEHIRNKILPLLEIDDLAQSIFLIFFFQDERTQLKRAWCPKDVFVLKSLGFPYEDVFPVTEGLPGVALGLSRWEVPLSKQQGRGLKGDLSHQHCADLTKDQFENQIHVPKGDWFIGIKSVVFLGVPVSTPDPADRIGQICICSPIPNLFGRKDIWEKDRLAARFFKPFVESVPQVIEKPRPFCKVFEDCVSYRQTSENRLAEALMFQTMGLTHKHRREASNVRVLWGEPIEKFLEFAIQDPSFEKIIANYNRQPRSINTSGRMLLDKIASIRKNAVEQLRFYEFLREFSHTYQPENNAAFTGDSENRQSALDPETYLQYNSFGSFQKHIEHIAHSINDGEKLRWKDPVEWKPIGPYLAKDAVEYIFYELLENALKRKPPDGVVQCTARTFVDANQKETLAFSVSNELFVVMKHVSKPGIRCDRCGEFFTRVASLKNRTLCSRCFHVEVIEFFKEECWWPQRTSGFGLFMIKRFVEQYYRGKLSAQCRRKNSRVEVTFSLELPVQIR